MTRRLRRRDLAPLAAGVLAAWCLPARAQDGKPDGKPDGGATPAKAKPPTVPDLALDWLKRHQSPDGRWRSDGFTACCSGEVCGGEGEYGADARATGVALQAFLGCGETHQTGTFRDTVKEGLKFLRNIQDGDGALGPKILPCWWSNHVAATEAFVEAFGMTQSVIFKDAAIRAVTFALAAMDPAKGFRSDVRDVAPDARAVAELVLLLRAVKLAEIGPDARPANDAALAWFAERTDPRTGAVRAEDPKAKPDALEDDDRAACAALARALCPADVEVVRKDDVIPRIADRLAARQPVWAPSPKGRMSFTAWERRTQALLQAHGEKHLGWNRALTKLLASKQRTDGCARGSFDPVDADGGVRGRVEATALCALATMWPYRWGWRLAPPKPEEKPAEPPK